MDAGLQVIVERVGVWDPVARQHVIAFAVREKRERPRMTMIEETQTTVETAPVSPDWTLAHIACNKLRTAEAALERQRAHLAGIQADIDAGVERLLVMERRQQLGLALDGDGREEPMSTALLIIERYRAQGPTACWAPRDRHQATPALDLQERYQLAVAACHMARQAVEKAKDVVRQARKTAMTEAQQRWVLQAHPELQTDLDAAEAWASKGRPEVAKSIRDTTASALNQYKADAPTWRGDGPGAEYVA
jgi:hypothetical protein